MSHNHNLYFQEKKNNTQGRIHAVEIYDSHTHEYDQKMLVDGYLALA